MTIPAFANTHIARFANALYGYQLGSQSEVAVEAEVAKTSLDAVLNSYYTATFGMKTVAQVAATLVSHMGLVAGQNGLTADAVAAASSYIAGQLNAASAATRGTTVKNILDLWANIGEDATLSATYGAAASAWNNQISNAQTYTATHAADAAIGSSSSTSSFVLTNGIDALTGDAGDNTFSAPIVQNQNGALSNTLESGDTIVGGAGTDTLNVVLTQSDSTTSINTAPAISATVSGVEVINVRTQFIQNDGDVNSSNIDAEKISGAKQYWSDNSRASLQIEDVRQLPEELTFGMRQTDPGVGYKVFFDPAQLVGNRSSTGNSSMTLKLVDNSVGASELAAFPVNGISFTLGGKAYTVSTTSALGATYATFATNLQAALKAVPELANVTATLNADKTITLTDPAGAAFVAKGYTWVGNVVPAGGNLSWDMTIGSANVTNKPVTTAVALDAVGRTAEGGALDIGSMATGGVEVFNVTVDRSSWLSNMASKDSFGVSGDHLATVNLASTGARGNLSVGGATTYLDGRVTTGGLVDVRTVDGSTFAGNLDLGIELTNNSIGRFMNAATGEVAYNYTAGAGADNFNVKIDGALAADPDFASTIKMGAGDDRLNLEITGTGTAKKVTVDGGTGNNTIAVASSHGDTATDTFKGFTGFQTYEVEGANPTIQDFVGVTGNMDGVTQINIATSAGAVNTQLIDVAAAAAVTITGKNQTLGNNSNAAQTFGSIAITGADSTSTDTTLKVTLQNTARIDGALTVNALTLNDDGASNTSGINTLELVSAGSRSTTNQVTDLGAERVNTFKLSGTQALDTQITAAATSTSTAGNLTVDGTALTGNLTLGLSATMISAVDAGAGAILITGTSGTSDTLILNETRIADGVDGQNLAISTDTKVSGFETVKFVEADGAANIGGFSGVTLYDLSSTDGALAITGMKGTETVQINTDVTGNGINATNAVAGDQLAFKAASASSSNVLSLNFKDETSATGSTTDFSGSEIQVQNFNSVKLDLAGASTLDEVFKFQIDGLDNQGLKDMNRIGGLGVAEANFAAANVSLRNVVITGGGDQGAVGSASGVDKVDLGKLTNVVDTIDFSAYKGQTTINLQVIDGTVDQDPVTAGTQLMDRNTVVKVNGYGMDFTEANVAADSHITTFQFTTDAVATTEDWKITGFNAFGAVGIDLGNLSVLDVSALGVTGLAALNIVDTGNDIKITSNGSLKFEILLVGVANVGDLSNENFKFAN